MEFHQAQWRSVPGVHFSCVTHFVIGLRRAEEMCLDQSIGMKKRLIEDLESQLRHKERQERWARGMTLTVLFSRQTCRKYLYLPQMV